MTDWRVKVTAYLKDGRVLIGPPETARDLGNPLIAPDVSQFDNEDNPEDPDLYTVYPDEFFNADLVQRMVFEVEKIVGDATRA